MATTPAKRVKAVRELLGLGREAFGDIVAIGYMRLATLENDRARMAVEDLASIIKIFPEFTNYLIHGDGLSVLALENSSNELCRIAAGKIKRGSMPDGYGLEQSIIYGV